MSRGVVILGSTGSVGRQALDVIRSCPDQLHLVGLAGFKNLDLLAGQIEAWSPKYVYAPAIAGERTWHGAIVLPLDKLCQVSEADCVLISTVGSSGLHPTLAALKAGKTVALANKEVLVMAGQIVIETAQRFGARILPIDSEHNAIWQCLVGECTVDTGRVTGPVRRIVLTASGGAFRDLPIDQLNSVTAKQALAHPTWVMGEKVTIDSATLMNKGFEVIEAHWLFGLPYDRIDVVLHRESIVHALVEFVDGSFKGSLGPPDMRLPLQYALTFPERRAGSWPRLRLEDLGHLTFAPLASGRYPCFDLAMAAAEVGGTMPAVLSASDDEAVLSFLKGQIAFNEISETVDRAMQAHQPIARPSLDEIVAADAEARLSVTGRIGQPVQLA
ncbi:MAG TPA: 1-deoxy-D-xylulose-5-phosphate reductoisomerase [Chloroflexota bacterium]|nr:1-deoxy-D-xylulose-5-phosphate reductoisomerase [Chloroflexota bacterium]